MTEAKKRTLRARRELRTQPCTRTARLGLVALLAAMALLQLAYSGAAAQGDVQITVIAFVDVAPATGTGCPGCNGDFDSGDQDYAQTHPLPTLVFAVSDGAGTVLARAETTELTQGIQRTLFTVPAGAAYDVRLETVPPDWQLCPADQPTQHLAEPDFTRGSARLEYHFTQGCERTGAAAALPAPTASRPAPVRPQVAPAQIQPAPRLATAYATATAVAAAATPLPPRALAPRAARIPLPTWTPAPAIAPAGSSARGEIWGFACIDRLGNGKVDADDPGLLGVRVFLSGDGGETFADTPDIGSFAFDDLSPGRYEVFVQPGPGWRLTTPARYTVDLGAGQVVMGNDFCMVGSNHPVGASADHGLRLPATGFTALPASLPGSLAALALGTLALLGAAWERRRNQRG